MTHFGGGVFWSIEVPVKFCFKSYSSLKRSKGFQIFVLYQESYTRQNFGTLQNNCKIDLVL